MQQNKAIPADALFHTLLLDGQNRIVVVGSPLFNNKMWKIYCSKSKDSVNRMENRMNKGCCGIFVLVVCIFLPHVAAT